MSRHRNVRSMNYQDEYDGYDDVYGHSVEDGDFCVSPTTAHYLSDRSNQPSLLEAFITPSKINEVDEHSDEEQNDPLQESSDFQRPQLSDIDEARLNSCLEEMRNIVGESTPEHLMVNAVIKNDFSFEKALSFILSQQEVPKPQRQRRTRTSRDPESGSLSPGSSSSSPDPSPSHTPPLPQPDSSVLKGTRRKGPLTSRLLAHDELGQENNQNVVESVSDKCPALKPMRTRSQSHSSRCEFLSRVQPGVRPTQPVPCTFSLASLAQTYSQSPPLPLRMTKATAADCRPRAPPGFSLSVLAEQQQRTKKSDPCIKAATIGHASLEADLQHLSLANMARERPCQTIAGPGICLGPRGLSSLAGSFLQTVDTADTPLLLPYRSPDDAPAPTTSPVACPGLSLASLAQQQQSDSPVLHGSSCLVDLAQQHMDDNGQAREGLNLQTVLLAPPGLEPPGRKVPIACENTPPPQSFSLASLIAQQMEGAADAPPKALWQHSSPNLSISNKSAVDIGAGMGPAFSLAALAKMHTFTSSVPTSVAESQAVCCREGLTGLSLCHLAQSHKSVNPSLSSLLCATHTAEQSGFSAPGPVTCAAQTKSLKVPPGFGKVDLAALAQHHQDSYHKLSPDTAKKKPPDVSAAAGAKQSPGNSLTPHAAHPSMFGQVMCSTIRNGHVSCIRNHHAHPKFAYWQQTTYDGTVSSQGVHDIVPFDFSFPSPDDLVKARQRGAFTRTGERIDYNSATRQDAKK